MFEVIVDGKTAKEKLFDVYKSFLLGDESIHRIVPKNNEIRKYCEFLKSYFPYYLKETNYLDNYFVMEIDAENYKIISWFIKDHENFLFEFPDEETAFYFKLKYC